MLKTTFVLIAALSSLNAFAGGSNISNLVGDNGSDTTLSPEDLAKAQAWLEQNHGSLGGRGGDASKRPVTGRVVKR